MQQSTLSELEEYSAEKFVIKKVFEGAHSKVLLLHLLPGQEVPIHPHPNFEVVLAPQKGGAVLTWEDGTETSVHTGTVYWPGISPVFGLKNTGQSPFQMLVTLISCPD